MSVLAGNATSATPLTPAAIATIPKSVIGYAARDLPEQQVPADHGDPDRVGDESGERQRAEHARRAERGRRGQDGPRSDRLPRRSAAPSAAPLVLTRSIARPRAGTGR